MLLALAHQNHVEHKKVSHWFLSVTTIAKVFLTCSITELGFVRVSVHAGLENDVHSARQTLDELKKSSPVPFAMVPDGHGIDKLPKYVKMPNQLTDGHLLELAKTAGAKFVTLDKGIPGALLVT